MATTAVNIAILKVGHTFLSTNKKKGKGKREGKLAVYPSVLGLSMEPKKVVISSAYSRDNRHPPVEPPQSRTISTRRNLSVGNALC